MKKLLLSVLIFTSLYGNSYSDELVDDFGVNTANPYALPLQNVEEIHLFDGRILKSNIDISEIYYHQNQFDYLYTNQGELIDRFDIHKVKFGTDLNALRDSGVGGGG